MGPVPPAMMGPPQGMGAIPLSPPGPQGPPGMAGPPAPGGQQVGALPHLVFKIERALDDLSSAIPDESEQIDEIKQLLRGVLLRAKPEEPGSTSSSPMEAGGPY